MKDFIEKFVEELEIESATELSGETYFRDLEEWSSLSVMILIAMFDEVYEKEIGGTDIKGCTTIADLYNLATK